MSKKLSKISVIVVARNEEAKIGKCLESVNFADEILVFDNNSTDKTSEISKKNGVKVLAIDEGDFSERKNFAFSKAKHNWILSLDADERVTSDLHDEIVKIIKHPNKRFGAYAIPRKNYIFGKEFKYGGLWPDYVVRLFRKDKFVRWEGRLHEQPVISGRLSYLKKPLIHFKHDTLEEMVVKTNEWSEVEAKLMFESSHPRMNIFRFLSAMLREFNLRMIRQKSFMDGDVGIIYTLYQVFSRFLSYGKLWEMQIKNDQ